MNAQKVIDNCNKSDFDPIQFRNEINLSFLINDAVKQWRKQNE